MDILQLLVMLISETQAPHVVTTYCSDIIIAHHGEYMKHLLKGAFDSFIYLGSHQL